MLRTSKAVGLTRTDDALKGSGSTVAGSRRVGIARRTTLRLGVAGGAALIIAPYVRRGHAQTVRVRAQISTVESDPTVATYRAAVAYMRGLPSNDRRSWSFQTSIHNNWCPHGNWYFLPWHREYLNAFEAVIRSLPVPGAADFSLPYWDWHATPTLPNVVAYPLMADGVTPNSLHDPSRQLAPGAAIPEEITGATPMFNAYAPTLFESFASGRPTGQTSTSQSWQRKEGSWGPLEATPHNGVHNILGGTMASFLSPADPIFWLHHANIDRIWASWNAQGGSNTSLGLWRNFLFSRNFARPTGSTYSIYVRDVRMGYTYDRLDPRPSAPTSSAVLAASAQRATEDQPDIFSVTNRTAAALGRPAQIQVPRRGRRPRRQAELRLRNIAPPPVANAPFVRVFLNHPSIRPDTPPEGPYYVGTFAFFGTPAQHAAVHDHGGMSRFSFTLPLTQVLERQRASGIALPDPMVVQLVPVALGGSVSQVEITPEVVEIEFR